MDAVLRGGAVYLFLIIIFRVVGRRTLAELTTFDLVLLLIISEATQNAMIGDDFSITNAVLVIATLVGLDIALGIVKRRFPNIEKVMDGAPLVLVENGNPLRWRMKKAHITMGDLAQALRVEGLEHLEQVRFAVLETDGQITIIPADAKQS